MTALLTAFALAIPATHAVAANVHVVDEECGLAYQLPPGWTESAQMAAGASRPQPRVVCSVEAKPRNWAKLADASRWGAGDPLSIDIYEPGLSLQAVVEDVYVRNEKGEWGVDGRFYFGRAQPFRRGTTRGYIAYGSFRGFAKARGSNRDDGDVFTGESATIVASSSGRVVVLQHACGSPDVHIDCGAAADLFLRTLKFVPRRRGATALEKAQARRAGRDAINCGDVPANGERSGVERCMVAAYDEGRPFHARFWLPSLDSNVAEGVARTIGGQLLLFSYDSAPCGLGCEPRLSERLCVKPYVWRDADGRHVGCAEPSFNEQFSRGAPLSP